MQLTRIENCTNCAERIVKSPLLGRRRERDACEGGGEIAKSKGDIFRVVAALKIPRIIVFPREEG